MTLSRIVAVEVLDGLAVDDPAAIRSRRDLRRVHRAMGTRTIVRRALSDWAVPRLRPRPLQVLELGAGDGRLLLGVARRLAPTWPPVDLTLLDAQPLVDGETIDRYAELGWTVVAAVTDVLDWATAPSDPLRRGHAAAGWDLIIANLFLHHFAGPQLATLLRAIAERSDRFLACEPRRAWLALAGSHLLGVIGASAVTRADAVLSVHAGFHRQELTALWPAVGVEWQVQEYSAGLFSHCFRAARVQAG